jgi:hypothetical protein
MIIDHVDRNPLNNQKINLRFADRQENNRNRNKVEGCSSGYKGVNWVKSRRKWVAKIYHNGTQYHLGYFKIEKDAALIYDLKAKELFGEFASLNFI